MDVLETDAHDALLSHVLPPCLSRASPQPTYRILAQPLGLGFAASAREPRNCATRNTRAIATATVAESDLKPE